MKPSEHDKVIAAAESIVARYPVTTMGMLLGNNYERKKPGRPHTGEVMFNPEKMYLGKECRKGHTARYKTTGNCVLCGRGKGFHMIGMENYRD